MERPEQVKDLDVLQIGRTVDIAFTLPARATDGERLTKPVEAELFRVMTPPGEKPPKTPVPPGKAQPWVVLRPGDMSRYTKGARLVYPFELSEEAYHEQQGSTMTVAVVMLTRGFRNRPIRSEASNVAEATVLDVAGPAQSLTVETTKKALILRWVPPLVTLAGAPASGLSGYRVYVSPTGMPGSFDAIGSARSPEFEDTDFEFGRHYYFMVRAVVTRNHQTAEGEDSTVAEVVPRDVFPPAAPQGLTGLYAAGAVELVWKANSEPDLAGYKVYRREGDQPFELLTPNLLRTPVYRDPSIEAGHRYLYSVSAVNLAGNESRQSPSFAIEGH